jgi:ArsR family transcriptional regulator
MDFALVKKNFGYPDERGKVLGWPGSALHNFYTGDIFWVDISAYADIFINMKATAQVFKALGDETRLRIMALLVSSQELCVCDIMAALDLPQSTVSRHLSYLRNAGLVDDRRQGIWMYYRINRERIEQGATLFDMLAAMLSGQGQAAEDQSLLKAHLATKEKTTCS